MTHRSSHYYVWFLVFGVAVALASVVGSGLPGLVAGVGVLGILDRFGLHTLADTYLDTGLVTGAAILGLSLAFCTPLIHTVLGLQSLNHGLKLSK
jgi:hypothetical protein